MTDWLVGRLLVATPLLEHPTFRRTVVLLLDHDDDGALGVVVNRPSAVDVEAVLPHWQRLATVPGRLFAGGPVQQDSALGLVTVPATVRNPRRPAHHRLAGAGGPGCLARLGRGRGRRAARLRRVRASVPR